MSDKILRALMQLFAIVANAERLTEQGRGIVESFLKQQLSQYHVQKYLTFFDEYLKNMQGVADPARVKKRVSVNSVKVLRICTDINAELNQKQKYIVLIRLIEFAYSSSESVTDQESEFLTIVSETFNITREEYSACLALAVFGKQENADGSRFLMVSGNPDDSKTTEKHIFHEGLAGNLYVLYMRQAGILFIRYFGDSSLTLNGIPVYKNSCYTLIQGSVIRGPRMQALYFSDIMQAFLQTTGNPLLKMVVKDISYVFGNGHTGLHPVSFTASSGNLVGIMGGSGAGKSTLLNVLNSNLKPQVGEVLLNGINIHDADALPEGIIGYVPQDDLLMDNLSVFQNLFFSSKLVFGNLDDDSIRQRCEEVLESLGLSEVRNLKVGSPLDKTISGGQRKRLNIALELIREPSVLFVDEPTSGLSSRDSENVMDLLKQLTIGGKLIFVVIHQPSSDIFKLFDKLLILDLGGYLVYNGNPSDSLLYFKRLAHFADADESECYACGNVNPEMVFAILEAKVVDEFGNLTPHRRITPEEWNHFYLESRSGLLVEEAEVTEKPVFHLKKPPVWKQFMVFIMRDVISKVNNRQYMFISLFAAPALALMLSFFLRYEEGGEYLFRNNMNIPAYLFMSVIVSLFLGLTVSAEEIIRDRKIRKRESFLHLSPGGYLSSKMMVLFFISAVQAFLFVIIGNSILGILGMSVSSWFLLFSVSCCANVMGLNISSAFNDAVTIYILIPIVVIPQILLSGVLVKFENMNPVVSVRDKVPVIGEVIVARWAFEALAVKQFKDNAYNKHFFRFDRRISDAYYKKDLWLNTLDDKLEEAKRSVIADRQLMKRDFQLIKTELAAEHVRNPSVTFNSELFREGDFSMKFYSGAKAQLAELKKLYISLFNAAVMKRENQLDILKRNGHTEEDLLMLKEKYTNESLDDLMLNSMGLNKIVEYEGKLVRNYQPVYMTGDKNSFIRAPFLVYKKSVFGKLFSTCFVNMLVIWSMTAFFAVTLYFDWLRKLVRLFGPIRFGR